jgi:glucan phosphoethanolaminetransferase (alkaline phosphatase superfamily)
MHFSYSYIQCVIFNYSSLTNVFKKNQKNMFFDVFASILYFLITFLIELTLVLENKSKCKIKNKKSK